MIRRRETIDDLLALEALSRLAQMRRPAPSAPSGLPRLRLQIIRSPNRRCSSPASGQNACQPYPGGIP